MILEIPVVSILRSKDLKRFHQVLVALFLFFLNVLGSGCSMEKGFIFFPDKNIVQTPADVALVFEDIYFQTKDGVRINGWFVPDTESRITLLWFHGNAGNLSHRVDPLRLFHHELKINIFMVDFREYGRSEGLVSEEGTRQDALSSYDYLLTRSDIDPAKIIVFGQSLGAAVAVELATNRDLQGIILEAPFTSIREMARAISPWLPFGRFLSTKYDSLSKIKQIRAPLLVMHGDRDEVIPFSQGRKLYEAGNEPKTFYPIPGAGHNNTYLVGGRPYFKKMKEFIARQQNDRK
ncbi:MAG: alpha/beta hydrolase [Nitrospira sp.]|nr:alpha/beta hydrolase [Candidatus Manganitrophaceae bacterium]HIL35060.1 alpha/beta hydrolase [Candidatus Manganitrophaceae bacterium]